MNKEEKVKYCFGLNQEHHGGDTFDSIEELIEYAENAYKNPDGHYWDEDMDDYPETIFIGVAHFHSPKDFAPSLGNIADQMTDSFYCECNVDDDADVQIVNRREAEEAWEAFVEKYFEIPHTMTAVWIGMYDIKEKKWVDKFEKEE